MSQVVYLTVADPSLVEKLVEGIESQTQDLNSRDRYRVFMQVASQLCENVAFASAGSATASSVARMVIIAAELDRKAADGDTI